MAGADEPRRFADEGSGLGDLFRAGRGEQPCEASRERILAGLGARLGAAPDASDASDASVGEPSASGWRAGAGGAGGAAPGAGAGLISAKLWVTLGLAGVAVAVAGLGLNRAASPATPAQTRRMEAKPAPGPKPTPGSDVPSQPTADTSALPAAALRVSPPRGAASDRAVRGRQGLVSPQKRVRVRSPTSAAHADARSELSLLRGARKALERAPRRALSLAEEHRTRFEAGVLVQEREVLAIDALLRIGARKRAQARALQFERRFPGSPHRRRVSELLR